MSGSSKQVNLQMPFSLKKQLVEDWKRVTQAPHELVPLPRKPNVQQVKRGSEKEGGRERKRVCGGGD